MADRVTFDHDLSLGDDFPVPSLETWREIAEKSLKGTPLDKLTRRLPEGVPVPPLFTRADAGPAPPPPGQVPFTRGRTPLGTHLHGWDTCIEASHPDVAEAAAQVEWSLARGASAVSARADEAVRRGLQPSHDLALDGPALDTTEAIDRLFEPVAVRRTPVFLDGGGNGLATAALFVAAARQRSVDLKAVRGGFRFDPLGALAEDGELTAGLDRSLDLMAHLAAWCDANAPGLRALTVSTVPYHTSGATAVQELAYALATGVLYLRHLEERGIAPEAGARQLDFVFAVGRDTFVEMAKLRAFRRLWSQVLAACGVDDPAPAPVHAATSPRTLTARDPWVNLLRVTSQVFAAMCGGAETITTQPFDAALGQPGDLGHRMALNTHTILREESHLHHVADPAGGSWYVERLTDDLAAAAWDAFRAIEADDGMRRAFTGGAVAEQLSGSLASARKDLATRKRPVTGVSTWPNLNEKPVNSPAIDADALLKTRRDGLDTWVGGHDTGNATQALADAAERGDDTLMDLAIEAAAQGATATELADALRAGSRANRIVPLGCETEAAGFERLRDAADAHAAQHGQPPRLFLATLGSIPEHKPRATFAKNFFEAGGIVTTDGGALEGTKAAVAAYRASGADRVCLCSSDARYADEAADVARALKDAGAATVLLAGRMGDHEQTFRAAGIDGAIFLGCDVQATLSQLLTDMGVLS
jgi:methylmalonyl-CoA mutase